jgi:hypothetical protein
MSFVTLDGEDGEDDEDDVVETLLPDFTEFILSKASIRETREVNTSVSTMYLSDVFEWNSCISSTTVVVVSANSSKLFSRSPIRLIAWGKDTFVTDDCVGA